jgi:hypothetical protein
MNTEYFYGQPGGSTSGPLALGSIIAAANAGKLGKETLVSPDGQTGWHPLSDLLPKDKPERVVVTSGNGRTVAGFLEVIGWVQIFAGLLSIILFVIAITQASTATFLLGVSAIGNLVGGIWFLAAAELLERLRDIAQGLREK